MVNNAASAKLSETDRLILEAATGVRQLTADELQRVLDYVARAGFGATRHERAGGRLSGVVWQGRLLRGSDLISSEMVHYLRHAVVQREWPDGTTLAEYLSSVRRVVTDAASGVFLSRFHGRHWQVTVVRRSGNLHGPGGHEWVMVEYRVETGHWITAFQPECGLLYITQDQRRQELRWLRRPV